MAVLPDYVTGTITVVQNSVNFTGTDTLWRTVRFREGDTVQLQGYTMVIKGTDELGQPIESNTSGQFTEPWPGTSGTFEYRMRFLPDGARVTAQSSTLIELLGDGTLAGLAQLGVEEGKAPVGGPAGQYVLEPVATDPNGSVASLAALTLAARQIFQTNSNGSVIQVPLNPDTAIVTNSNGDLYPTYLGALGRALLELTTGTNAQYVQGDGTLQAKAGLPVSTATQTALNGKLSLSGGNLNGSLSADGVVTLNIPQTGAQQYARAFSTNIGASIGGRLLVEYNPGSYYATLIQLVYPGGTREYYFKNDGSFTAYGAINGAAKNFEIDHPCDPDNYDLRHCATEAPEMLVEYRGTAQLVNGRVTVDVELHYGVQPGTFDALWADAWVTALQNQDGFDRLKPSRVTGATFEVICENETSSDLVSWVVMARRNDPYVRWDGCKFTDSDGKLIIEFEKEDA